MIITEYIMKISFITCCILLTSFTQTSHADLFGLVKSIYQNVPIFTFTYLFTQTDQKGVLQHLNYQLSNEIETLRVPSHGKMMKISVLLDGIFGIINTVLKLPLLTIDMIAAPLLFSLAIIGRLLEVLVHFFVPGILMPGQTAFVNPSEIASNDEDFKGLASYDYYPSKDNYDYDPSNKNYEYYNQDDNDDDDYEYEYSNTDFSGEKKHYNSDNDSDDYEEHEYPNADTDSDEEEINNNDNGSDDYEEHEYSNADSSDGEKMNNNDDDADDDYENEHSNIESSEDKNDYSNDDFSNEKVENSYEYISNVESPNESKETISSSKDDSNEDADNSDVSDMIQQIIGEMEGITTMLAR